MKVGAPARAAARAWFAPLPPSTIEKRSPITVSPGRGSGDANAVRSALMLPTTATPPGTRHARSQYPGTAPDCQNGRVLEPMTAADEAAVTAQLERPPRGVAGVAYRCPCGTARRGRDPAPAGRRHTVPDDVLPDLPAGHGGLLDAWRRAG